MKKLITILLTTFFICTASYGATIKELLKGKQSIKLSCITEKAKRSSFRVKGLYYHDRSDYIGDKYFFEIKEKSFISDISDGPWYILGRGPYERKLGIENKIYHVSDTRTDVPYIEESTMEITDNYYNYRYISYEKGKKWWKFSFEKININRYSGKFYFEKQNRPLDTNIVVEGTCSKVKDKIF